MYKSMNSFVGWFFLRDVPLWDEDGRRVGLSEAFGLAEDTWQAQRTLCGRGLFPVLASEDLSGSAVPDP